MDGRGAYLCNSEECRRVAFEKGFLQRALEVEIPAQLRAQLTGEASTLDESKAEGGDSRGQE
jgi:predicted RNA-binding protein YlxR (DUF448 family)